MKGITWLEVQAVMVIVAEPAGSWNGSDVDRPTPTTVTVVPSRVTPGDGAGAGGWVATGAGVGVAAGAEDPQAATTGSTKAASTRADVIGARRMLMTSSRCGDRWRRGGR